MIYVHRDWGKVPQDVKDALKAASDALELLVGEKARKAFIAKKENQRKWAALRQYFLESRDSVGRLQVDHFRPHGSVKQAERLFAAAGYSWLAFELENFRLAGQLCNTVNAEYSQKSVGKGTWFPLKYPKKRASLNRRLIRNEVPLLLDPTVDSDIAKIIFKDDGSVSPAPNLSEADAKNVDIAVRCLGLSQSALDRNRCEVWKACSSAIQRYSMMVRKIDQGLTAEETKVMEEAIGELVNRSKSDSPFTAVARCCLIANGMAYLIVRDELPVLMA